ncbi:hypothetical protein B0H16DRAFT_1728437 [Mycena metata]|uniref:Uncharacterized protein n=1 Tax=Mycena metata TaxID=1033252 RepID=A0AAD7IF37_9AGAR|nr:hypothetical protein B0H16DRAFT_1728437 [Mycena metata]
MMYSSFHWLRSFALWLTPGISLHQPQIVEGTITWLCAAPPTHFFNLRRHYYYNIAEDGANKKGYHILDYTMGDEYIPAEELTVEPDGDKSTLDTNLFQDPEESWLMERMDVPFLLIENALLQAENDVDEYLIRQWALEDDEMDIDERGGSDSSDRLQRHLRHVVEQLFEFFEFLEFFGLLGLGL